MKHHHTSALRLGITVLACGVALGTASAVALGNALYDMVS